MKTKGLAYVAATIFLLSAVTVWAESGGLVWDGVNNGLGINVAYPQYTLDVSSLGKMESQLHFSLNGSNVGGWITAVADNNFFASSGVYYDNAAGGWIQASPDGKSVIAGSGGSGYRILLQSGCTVGQVCPPAEKLRIDYSGNVGIGTPSPSQKLEVNGGVKLNTTEARPVCDANSRGTFWLTQDDASGDSADVCARVGGAYAWRQLF